MEDVLNLAEYLTECKKSKVFQKAFESWINAKKDNFNLKRIKISEWEKLTKKFLNEKA